MIINFNEPTEYGECHCCHSRLPVLYSYEMPPGAYRPDGLTAVDTERLQQTADTAIHHLRAVIHALDIEGVVTGHHPGNNLSQKIRDAMVFLVAFDTGQPAP